MVEVKTCAGHPSSMSERVTKRLRNSGDTDHADTVVQKGSGPTRTNTNIHNLRNQQYGQGYPGEGDVYGRKRGVV